VAALFVSDFARLSRVPHVFAVFETWDVGTGKNPNRKTRTTRVRVLRSCTACPVRD